MAFIPSPVSAVTGAPHQVARGRQPAGWWVCWWAVQGGAGGPGLREPKSTALTQRAELPELRRSGLDTGPCVWVRRARLGWKRSPGSWRRGPCADTRPPEDAQAPDGWGRGAGSRHDRGGGSGAVGRGMTTAGALPAGLRSRQELALHRAGGASWNHTTNPRPPSLVLEPPPGASTRSPVLSTTQGTSTKLGPPWSGLGFCDST